MPKQKRKKRINSIINWSRYIPIILSSLFFVAFSLRFYGLPRVLFFGPEQGIDFFKIRDIALGKDLVLVGAKTDIAGIFHGPVYYYLGVIPFLLSHGNPLFISAFFIVLNSLTVFFIYKLGKELYGKRGGIVASLLFTFSFGAISYSRWLSSHPLTIPPPAKPRGLHRGNGSCAGCCCWRPPSITWIARRWRMPRCGSAWSLG